MSNTINTLLSPYIVGMSIETLSQTMGLVKNCNVDATTAAGVKGETISMAKPASLSAAAITAANTAPAPSDITIGAASVTLDQFYKASFAITGKENLDYNVNSWFPEQVKEAIRAVVYQINSSVHDTYYKIPYFTGNSGTAFFYDGSNYELDNLPAANKVLTDNLCPKGNRFATFTTSDFRDMMTVESVYKVNEFGSNQANQLGYVSQVHGFSIYEDQQVADHTIGTITTGLATKSATTQAVGTTSLVCTTAASTGACALKQGDIITVDSKTYSLQADATEASASTDVTLTLDRGLEIEVTGGEAVALATNFDANSPQNILGDFRGFSVASRVTPTEVFGYGLQGEHMIIQDPVSGFPLTLSFYGQYHQGAFEVSALWGVDVTDSRRLCRGLTASTY